jgi:predicted ArsR family transcriptional regulator
METKKTDLNPTYKKAARVLNRKSGATVEQLAKALEFEERPARLLIDRLRRKGLKVENVGRCRFKLVG